jgi:hypothetical protein
MGDGSMNIFILHNNPIKAASMQCDKHIPKMVLETAQMMASALRRHGATDEQMPLTKSGTPYKTAHPHHPCTVWAGDSGANFRWLAQHGLALCLEYKMRFGKEHACHKPIGMMYAIHGTVPHDSLTPFAQAMPDEYRDDDTVTAYRAYYHSKEFAKWDKGTPAPSWWQGIGVVA